jgi:hypothetical protein
LLIFDIAKFRNSPKSAVAESTFVVVKRRHFVKGGVLEKDIRLNKLEIFFLKNRISCLLIRLLIEALFKRQYSISNKQSPIFNQV